MKAITVNVPIQFDASTGSKDEVLAVLELINNVLQNAGMEQQPQILLTAIDESDITSTDIGDDESDIVQLERGGDTLIPVKDGDFEDYVDPQLPYRQSKWTELRDDHEDEGILHIDGWLTEDDDDENGKTIVKIDTSTGKVLFVDQDARKDWLANEVIRQNLKEIKHSQKKA